MNTLHTLTESFSKFPGIGPRQAKRFVYFLLAQNPEFTAGLSRSLADLRENILQCTSCFRFFQKSVSGENLCPTCKDSERDASLVLVVEKDADLENIQKMHAWNGLYFVLGGSLPILEKDPTKKIRSKELFYSIQERAKTGFLREVVLAMSANVEGENTLAYLSKILAPLAEKYAFEISTLGRGLSTGTELEYSDADTFTYALKNRQTAE
ncbi:MAG: recombination protein RecR [Parcubacteria group bacterium]|nr:recombination protein RecR [Parcubacteria group bacterium]